MKVLCVTPNVAIDRTLTVPGFREGGVWRAAHAHIACGGKGINVARALKPLGQDPLCAGILAGHGGRLVADAAAAEGLAGRWTWVAGETRTSFIIVGEHGRATVVNEPGLALTDADWRRFIADIRQLAGGCAAVAISGSLPPGVSDGALRELIAAAAGDGQHADERRPVWVDTSGEALATAIATRPADIKVNADEAAALLGWKIATPTDALQAAREIRRRGPARVALTLGDRGAVIATDRGDWHAWPPRLHAVNPVGSGDCFLAGLISGLGAGVTPEEALRLATACGTGNAIEVHIGLPDPTKLTWLLVGTQVRQVA
ncbi:MAG: 1-phosphofructokinase family hexose kinase [Rhodospirillales bacterium]|nr:1-phosphofructokinase family hexose kinase [Rhodospirillales bacterium]